MSQHQWVFVEDEIGPPPPPRQKGLYDEVWDEGLLRLEQTPSHKWLRIMCEDALEADRLGSALYNRAQRLGKDVVIVEKRLRLKRVYIKRGPNWAQRGAGSLAHIPASVGDAPTYNGKRTNGNGKGPGRPRKVKD